MNVIDKHHTSGIDFIHIDSIDGLPHISYDDYRIPYGYWKNKPESMSIINEFLVKIPDEQYLKFVELQEPLYFQWCELSHTKRYEYCGMKGIKRFFVKYFWWIILELQDLCENGLHQGYYQFYREFK